MAMIHQKFDKIHVFLVEFFFFCQYIFFNFLAKIFLKFLVIFFKSIWFLTPKSLTRAYIARDYAINLALPASVKSCEIVKQNGRVQKMSQLQDFD